MQWQCGISLHNHSSLNVQFIVNITSETFDLSSILQKKLI